MNCSKGHLIRHLYLHEQACSCRLNTTNWQGKSRYFLLWPLPCSFSLGRWECWLLTIYTNHMGPVVRNRVCTGHGKPGKSWNSGISFSRPGKSWNLIVGPGKSCKIKDLYNRSVTAVDHDKARLNNIRSRQEIKQCKRHTFWWTDDTRVCVRWTALGKKYAKTRKVLKIFENDSLT